MCESRAHEQWTEKKRILESLNKGVAPRLLALLDVGCQGPWAPTWLVWGRGYAVREGWAAKRARGLVSTVESA